MFSKILFSKDSGFILPIEPLCKVYQIWLSDPQVISQGWSMFEANSEIIRLVESSFKTPKDFDLILGDSDSEQPANNQIKNKELVTLVSIDLNIEQW